MALFGLPGAYTPVCHKEHLPGIVALHDTLHQHGIDTVACTAVNDVFVLSRWAKDPARKGKVLMLADGNADFAVKSGLAIDLTQVRARHPLEPLRDAGSRRRRDDAQHRERAFRARQVERGDAVREDGRDEMSCVQNCWSERRLTAL